MADVIDMALKTTQADMANSQHLIDVRLDELRPTQMTVGLAEVKNKRAEWAALSRKERKRSLDQHWFPAVRGPGKAYYITDHHHLGFALIEEKVERAWVMVMNDFSWLPEERFWAVMEFHHWAHPYDEKGRRHEFKSIPERITDLHDDPYRSLAGFVRTAGGFAKDSAAYAEFLWADYFRPLIPASLIRRSHKQAVEQAIGLARDPDARYLPGWTGRAESRES